MHEKQKDELVAEAKREIIVQQKAAQVAQWDVKSLEKHQASLRKAMNATAAQEIAAGRKVALFLIHYYYYYYYYYLFIYLFIYYLLFFISIKFDYPIALVGLLLCELMAICCLMVKKWQNQLAIS